MNATQFLLPTILFLNYQFVFSQDNLKTKPTSTLDKIEQYNNLRSERDNLWHTKLPEFSALDILSKSTINNKSLEGKIVVLNFGTSEEDCTWAEFQHEELNYLYHQIDTNQVEIISIYSGKESDIYKNREVDSNGFPILIMDETQKVDLFKIGIYPTSLLIDKNGVIRTILQNSSWNSIQKEIQKLNIIRP